MSGEPGDHLAICAFSGFLGRASEMAKTWDGQFVLRRFIGSEARRQPQDLVRSRPDDQRVAWSQPEPTDVFLSSAVLPSDL